MLDIKFIRENKEVVIAGAKKKHMTIDIDRLIALDDQRKELQQKIDEKRSEQNIASTAIMATQDAAEKQAIIEKMTGVKETLKLIEESLAEVMKEWRILMLHVPNVPDMSVPDGDSDADNQEIKAWGEKPQFDFTPKSHTELMLALDMVDFDRGAKVSGFRGYFLKNDGARLAWAVWRYAQDFFLKKDFIPMIVPSLVRKEPFMGTGYLPQSEDDLYKTQDGEYLAGTGEVGMMGYHMDETLTSAELPKKYLAYSPCFRREIGTHGKDTKGLIRVHEFFKFEQVILCEANHEKSVAFHEELTKNAEELILGLGLPYHVVVNCGGDLGLGQVKKYDIEAWVPSEGKYRETHSSSYFHDFQSRRLNLRYKDTDGKTRFVHSLNNTAIATPRVLVAVIENYQNADGTIRIPEVLQPFMGKALIGG